MRLPLLLQERAQIQSEPNKLQDV